MTTKKKKKQNVGVEKIEIKTAYKILANHFSAAILQQRYFYITHIWRH